MKVKSYIEKRLRKGPLHFSLLDPDKSKISAEKLGQISEYVRGYGTDAIMVGGSTNIDTKFLDDSINIIKKHSGLPVILFPGGLNGISRYADAIFFMSLMNSTDPFWIVRAQAKGAPIIKKLGIEPIPMAYLIVEPGMEVARVGKAEAIRYGEPEKAAEYALAAQYMGMSLVYLEAGSGAHKHVPEKMVRMVKNAIDIPLIVGGGIRSPESTKKLLMSGADIIVTGTALENGSNMESIINAVKSFKR